jgi:hypothetical protein
LRKYTFFGLLALIIAVFVSCSSSVDVSKKGNILKSARIVVLPFINNTETPLAGIRAAKIAEGVFAARGYNVANNIYKQKEYSAEEIKEMIAEAKREGYRYAVIGYVNEWRYKTGIDGEPAVSLTMKVIDLANETPVFSGVASKSGLGYSSIGVLAQELIDDMVSSIND